MSELVDYERAFLYLKAHIGTKRNHGARELLEVMARLEVESMYGDEAPAPNAPTDSGPLGSDAGSPPSEATPSKPTTDAQEASWTPTHPQITTSSPSPRERSSPPLVTKV